MAGSATGVAEERIKPGVVGLSQILSPCVEQSWAVFERRGLKITSVSSRKAAVTATGRWRDIQADKSSYSDTHTHTQQHVCVCERPCAQTYDHKLKKLKFTPALCQQLGCCCLTDCVSAGCLFHGPESRSVVQKF